jgi:hypothetical protein
MAGLSDTYEAKVLEHLVGKTALAAPANLWAALLTAAPTDASTGSTITEATGLGGFARLQIPAASWGSASGTNPTQIANNTPLTFFAVTSGTATISHVALLDAASAGNVVAWAALAQNITLSVTQTPATIVSGALVITLD